MGKIASYAAAIALGLLAVHPPIGYECQPYINSGAWLYAVVASGLMAFFLLTQKLNAWLKALIIYLFLNCFLSQAPATSFNMFFIASATMVFYLICRHLDFEPIFQMIEAVFWMQVFIIIVQQFGKDTLMEFGAKIQWDGTQFTDADTVANGQRRIFLGTVFQPMRMASLFAIMTPLLLERRKLYIIPLLILAVCSYTLGFSLALIFGIAVYGFIEYPQFRIKGAAVLVLAAIACCFLSWQHIYVEVIEGRVPIWWVILKSWFFDTSANFHGFGSPLNPAAQSGPFCLQTALFGHGLNTFIHLFAYYKYDPNPFPQAHNDFLSFGWELGLTGLGIFTGYAISLIRNLWLKGMTLAIAGLSVISFNMFFAFPWYMTQTVLIMVATAAYYERKAQPLYGNR